jgi:biotin-(acetyl-CoA carboxylase) ligase
VPSIAFNFDKFEQIQRYRWVPLVTGYAISKVLGHGYRVKWPNDIYAAEKLMENGREPDWNELGNWKKVSGVLVDSEMM